MRHSRNRRYAGGKRSTSGNLILGIALLAVGGLLFAREYGAELPAWLFRWELIVIIAGISIGVKSRFRDFGWLVVTGVGLFFLSDDIFPGWNASRFIFPVSILALGAFILVSRLSSANRREDLARQGKDETDLNPALPNELPYAQDEEHNPRYSHDHNQEKYSQPVPDKLQQLKNPARETVPTSNHSAEEIIDIVSVFSGLNRKVFSKNFMGGDIVCVFGGSEVNLMNADFSAGTIELEVVLIFGGATLFIPPNWHVISDMGSIFGGIDDKRKNSVPDQNKTLLIKGVCIFGGLEIKTKY